MGPLSQKGPPLKRRVMGISISKGRAPAETHKKGVKKPGEIPTRGKSPPFLG